jgi:hypothetical protein
MFGISLTVLKLESTCKNRTFGVGYLAIGYLAIGFGVGYF